jgi:hypothetical protein
MIGARPARIGNGPSLPHCNDLTAARGGRSASPARTARCGARRRRRLAWRRIVDGSRPELRVGAIPDRRVCEGSPPDGAGAGRHDLRHRLAASCIGGPGAFQAPCTARARRSAPDRGSGALAWAAGQLALGSADIMSDADGASLEMGAVLGLSVAGVEVPAGVLQASTAPPREAARPRASRIRLNIGWESSVEKRVPTVPGTARGLGRPLRPKVAIAAERALDVCRASCCRGLAARSGALGQRFGTCNDRDTTRPARPPRL